MSDAGNELFDVYFAGECLDGHDPGAVRAALGKLFKADDATLDRLFSGSRQVVKRGCDRATALTYQKALTGAGAKPVITRAAAPGKPDSPSAEPATAAAPTPAPSAVEFDVAPPGSDVLRAEERQTIETADIDTGHLSVADTGSDLSERSEPVAPAAVAPDLDIAEAGAVLAPQDPAPIPAAPDISDLELSPPGHSLEDCAPAPASTPDLALDHLDLAPEGTDLLTEAERQPSQGTAPDTSHLQLQGDGEQR